MLKFQQEPVYNVRLHIRDVTIVGKAHDVAAIERVDHIAAAAAPLRRVVETVGVALLFAPIDLSFGLVMRLTAHSANGATFQMVTLHNPKIVV